MKGPVTAEEVANWPEFSEHALPILRDARCLIDRASKGKTDQKWLEQAAEMSRAIGNLLNEPNYVCPWCAERGGSNEDGT